MPHRAGATSGVPYRVVPYRVVPHNMRSYKVVRNRPVLICSAIHQTNCSYETSVKQLPHTSLEPGSVIVVDGNK